MIASFKNKGLKELFETGRTAKINAKQQPRIRRILDLLDQAKVPSDMNVPGYDFHPHKATDPTKYVVSVNGPWRVTFEFQDGHALRVDLEQYH